MSRKTQFMNARPDFMHSFHEHGADVHAFVKVVDLRQFNVDSQSSKAVKFDRNQRLAQNRQTRDHAKA